MVRNRPLAAAGASAVVLIATLGITSNQSITKSLVTDTALYNRNDFGSYAKRSLLVFAWRFTPLSSGSDAGAVWRSQVIENVLWVVLTFLAVLVVARGRVALGQVFLGAFTATVVAAVIAKIIGSFALPRYYRYPTNTGRATSAVFGAPNGALLFYALCVGVVVAAVVTVITAVSRVKEPDAVAVASAPSGPDAPYGGRSGGIEYRKPEQQSPPPPGEQQPYGAAAPQPGYGAPAQGYGQPERAPERAADQGPSAPGENRPPNPERPEPR